MIHRPHVDWLALAPANTLLTTMAICLLAAVLAPTSIRRAFAASVAATGFLVSGIFAAVVYAHSAQGESIIGGAFRRDRFGALAAIIIAGAGLLSIGVSHGERMRDDHVAEYYALLAAAGGGMIFLASAQNLMTLFLALEWFSIALYVLCAIDSDRERGLEAGLKYLIVGSFGSAILLFGSALVYGATGQLNFERIAQATAQQGLKGDALLVAGLAMMITGFGFKASAAPFHMWTPDVYDGAPTPVTAFMSAATKTVALLLTMRVLVTAFPQERHLWTVAIAVIAIVSLAWGNIAALVQRNVKRMLAYSSVSHAGFMLIAVAAGNALGGRALLYYLIPYSAMSIGAFAVVAARERELGRAVEAKDFAGYVWERPLLGVSLWTFMLGFAGFPLTGGFVGKFYVFAAAHDRGWDWLIIAGVIATAISLYYYLGIVRALWMRPREEPQLAPAGGSPPRELLLQASVAACLAITVGSFFAVQPLIDLGRHASRALPF
ncbi:MAG: NADH-quinone oxidoreductase subunit N [Gaiellaceae bacterium]